jgi:small subunit ribosomal protein S5
MARAAGIHDLAARVPRGRNKMNTIKATYEALLSQKLPDEIARGRGKKFVDVRKVYYGGDQPVPPQRREDGDGDRLLF